MVTGVQTCALPICHCFVAGVGWVRMVSAIEQRKDLRRRTRVSQYTIEIDHRVVLAAQANPGIDRLALHFLGRREDGERGSRQEEPFHRSKGAAVNLQPLCVCAFDELLLSLNDLIGP